MREGGEEQKKGRWRLSARARDKTEREREGKERARGERWLNTVRSIIVCTTNCEIYDNGRTKRRAAGEERECSKKS